MIKFLFPVCVASYLLLVGVTAQGEAAEAAPQPGQEETEAGNFAGPVMEGVEPFPEEKAAMDFLMEEDSAIHRAWLAEIRNKYADEIWLEGRKANDSEIMEYAIEYAVSAAFLAETNDFYWLHAAMLMVQYYEGSALRRFAFPFLAQALEINPFLVPAHLLMGQLSIESLSFSDAVDHLEAAIVMQWDLSQNEDIVRPLGIAYGMSSDFERGVDFLGQCIEISGDAAPLRRARSILLHALDRDKEAFDELDLVRNNPAYPDEVRLDAAMLKELYRIEERARGGAR